MCPEQEEEGSEETPADLVGPRSAGVEGSPGAETAPSRGGVAPSRADRVALRGERHGPRVDKLANRAVQRVFGANLAFRCPSREFRVSILAFFEGVAEFIGRIASFSAWCFSYTRCRSSFSAR
jgi:hypothetical protein